MKKTLLAVLAVLGSAAMLACSVTSTTTTATTEAVLPQTEDVVVFQAVSASELLTSALDSASLLSQNLSMTADGAAGATSHSGGTTTTTTTEAEDPVVTEDIDVLDQYLTMMEQFLGTDEGLAVTITESDLPDYAFKVVFVTRDLLGMDVTYTLYYNEVLYEDPVDDGSDDSTTTTTTTTETTVPEETTAPEETTTPEETTETTTTETEPLAYHSSGTDPQYQFQDEDGDEILYALTGILVVGDLTYNLEGKKVLEGTEEIFSLYSYVDQDNFVKVRYQTDTEDGNRKFFYEVKVDGIVTNKSKVMVGTDPDDGALMVKLEFIEGDASGRYQFKIETVDNVTTIKIKYETESADGVEESGMIIITATYDEATDTTTYEYTLKPENGRRECTMEKTHEDHHGHEDQGQQGHSGNGSDDDSEGNTDDGSDSTTTTEPDIFVG